MCQEVNTRCKPSKLPLISPNILILTQLCVQHRLCIHVWTLGVSRRLQVSAGDTAAASEGNVRNGPCEHFCGSACANEFKYKRKEAIFHLLRFGDENPAGELFCCCSSLCKNIKKKKNIKNNHITKIKTNTLSTFENRNNYKNKRYSNDAL